MGVRGDGRRGLQPPHALQRVSPIWPPRRIERNGSRMGLTFLPFPRLQQIDAQHSASDAPHRRRPQPRRQTPNGLNPEREKPDDVTGRYAPETCDIELRTWRYRGVRASSAAEIRRGMRRGRRAHGRGESLARSEREATADLIAHLAELDARRLYLGAGFSSSEAEAYNRIEAARAARRFPAILDMLGDGALTSPQCASSPRTWMTTTNGSCSRPHPAKAGAKSRSCWPDTPAARCRAHNAYEAEVFYGRRKFRGGEGVLRESCAPVSSRATDRTRSGTSPATITGGAVR